MTTATQARQVIRARMEAGLIRLNGELVEVALFADFDEETAMIEYEQLDRVPLRWQNEDGGALPDTPSPFIYTLFHTGRAGIAGYGGGRGNNLYRNPARVEAYVFVPKGVGLDQAEYVAEQVAALFRSYRDEHISCFDATVYPGGDGAELTPPGLTSEVGNYFWAACEVSLHFDQIG